MQEAHFLTGHAMGSAEEESLEVRSDALWLEKLRTADLVVGGHCSRCRCPSALSAPVAQLMPLVQVLSTGRSWHERDPSFALYERMVHSVLAALQHHFRGTHLILHTSSWGHQGCSSFHQPLLSADQALAAAEERQGLLQYARAGAACMSTLTRFCSLLQHSCTGRPYCWLHQQDVLA